MASLTFIGLGPMGQAMVRVLLAAGHRVTVWNRTASRADDLVTAGAVRAATPAEAVAANELVILSLTDYQAMYDVLGPAQDVLRGRVVVNLSSDSPGRTRAAAQWLAERGAQLVAGGVMVPAELVGTPEAMVFYSGPAEAFEAHADTLRVIGRPDYRGADPALAQLYYQALLDVFLTFLAAYAHAAALVGSAGVDAATFFPYAKEFTETLTYYLDGTAEAFDTGEHPGEAASAAMMGATACHIVAASEETGIDPALPAAVKSLYDRTIAAGHGTSGWTAMIDVIRGR
ncbi:3-hydroxyisobutyrate dehydrogenase [Pseudonocardia thermophila]|uniref:3-hydroxyisobutyrate dehydrogenase n=1 Tax=Pseudonocardia thermophila TaxID=1848 RepID=A0A1M6XY92_PSETH|nr:NAD(P)-binding domain-containing protein [Pseudonocardia thermophila]SHL11002.1 3-hydroxyisobutyrate dehydrogenase [Pseudonocardia thermophila]